jgi:hypothetical protein
VMRPAQLARGNKEEERRRREGWGLPSLFDDNFKGGSEPGLPGTKHRKFSRKSGQDAQRCRASGDADGDAAGPSSQS